MLSWLFPNTYGEERRCALGRESIDKLMQITGRAAILAAALTGKAAILAAALTGRAAILAAREYAFYPFGSSTLTSAATMESPSPIAIGLVNCASN